MSQRICSASLNDDLLGSDLSLHLHLCCCSVHIPICGAWLQNCRARPKGGSGVSLLPGGQVWVFTRATVSRGKSKWLGEFILPALQISQAHRLNWNICCCWEFYFLRALMKHFWAQGSSDGLYYFTFLPLILYLVEAGLLQRLNSFPFMCLEISGGKLPSSMHVTASCCLFAKLCLTLLYPMDCDSPGSYVYGIFQARILEWVAIFFSRFLDQGSNPHRLHCRQILYLWATREAHLVVNLWLTHRFQIKQPCISYLFWVPPKKKKKEITPKPSIWSFTSLKEHFS